MDDDIRRTCNPPVADVTVVTPHVPNRVDELARCVASVEAQRMQPLHHLIVTDNDREGSAVVRNRGLNSVTTEWTAFLDDDDELLPHHIRVLYGWALKTGADVLYPECRIVMNGQDVPNTPEWAGRPGRPFDPDILRQRSFIPVTSLVRTSLAQFVGGFGYGPASTYDDHFFYLKCLDAGAKFLHVPVVTWKWHHHADNSSGRPERVAW